MKNLLSRITPQFRAQSRHFYLLAGLTLVIVAIGLAMVASASVVDSYKETDSAAGTFLRQGFFALVGLVALMFASVMPLSFYRRFAGLALGITLILQVFTVLFGRDINGNRNWLSIGGITLQPSEFLKVGLVIFIALLISRLGSDEVEDRRIWLQIFGVSGISLALVAVAGRDMGTGVVMTAMFLGLYFFSGMRISKWLGVTAIVALVGLVGVLSGASRLARFEAWLFPADADPMGVRWQFEHGTWALAAGGLFGSGLGRSKLKWSWIPEVENDFIFAIIGEELGLIGAGAVILLFFILGLTFFAIAQRQTDPFARNLVIGVMLWITLQAFINISVVLGLLPVLGVPLPLISAGGSSLIATLGAIGMVLAVERHRVRAPLAGARR